MVTQFQPRGMQIVEALLDKGVDIPNPLSLDIGPEVDPERICGDGVTIHPGCRIRGAKTVISAGASLGSEGPVTLVDCRLGEQVALKGGYAANAVFLDGASMGLGHHVREGTLLEEEANGAHCVGLKQTILFPFVTLGSLINFCDCLMAGGTSRKDHSEVGSSYIHFNFTPDGDKTTPSLFGEVPAGVMLNRRPIFLGGQGGTVGPIRVGYGSVVAAGSILRSDVPADQLVMAGPLPSAQVAFAPSNYRAANRLVAKNVAYLAQLRALDAWYQQVRAPFFAAQQFGPLLAEGAAEMLASARQERTSRLRAMVAKVPADDPGKVQLREHIDEVCGYLEQATDTPDGPQSASAGGVAEGVVTDGRSAGGRTLVSPAPGSMLAELTAAAQSGQPYLAAVQQLSPAASEAGTAWLQGIVDQAWERVVQVLPTLARMPRP